MSEETTPDAPANSHWVLCVTFSIKPEHADEFVSIVSPVLDKMRHSENFVSTTLSHDPKTPGRFFLFETWKSRARFLAEDLSFAYRKPYETRLPDIQLADRRIEEWEQVRADFSLSTGSGKE
jgi:quinol monooxygenase YgiN